jgi:twitching motility protein PilI
MADREALRDFQRRLTARLQAAPTHGAQVHWLAVEAGSGHFLIPLAQAGEIFPSTCAQPVPYTQPWFLGVVCLRGDLYGLSDLARLIGSDAAQSSRFPASGTEAQLVTLNPALDAQCALRIDRLAGLRGLDAFKASAPAPEGSPGWFGSVYHDASNARWQEINLQSLSQQPRFLRIGV